jgi:hypothetical protein
MFSFLVISRDYLETFNKTHQQKGQNPSPKIVNITLNSTDIT